MTATIPQPHAPPVTSSDVRRERLARRLDDVALKCRNSDSQPSEELKKKDAMRNAAQARYQSAVDDFVSQAKANALEKKKKSRDEMIAIFLLLILDASEEAYEAGYAKLAEMNPAANERHEATAKIIKAEAVEFAKGRRQFLSNFPTATIQRLTDVITQAEDDEASEKEIRALLNADAEKVKAGTGKIVAETEAQATYGAAELRVLQRAGFKTVRWVTMEDERVRKSHVECGEQAPVKLGRSFVNGLRFPGDPNGGPEEIINCRCWLEGVSK